MLHVPRNSTEEYKILKEYCTKYAAQQPHNEREALSGGNKKRGKTIKFNKATEEVNRTTAHDASIPRKMRRKIMQKILRVTRTLQSHKRRNAFMRLTN